MLKRQIIFTSMYIYIYMQKLYIETERWQIDQPKNYKRKSSHFPQIVRYSNKKAHLILCLDFQYQYPKSNQKRLQLNCCTFQSVILCFLMEANAGMVAGSHNTKELVQISHDSDSGVFFFSLFGDTHYLILWQCVLISLLVVQSGVLS